MIMTHTLAMKINTPPSNIEERKIKWANKISAILAKFCMHAGDNRSQDKTSRDANSNVLPSSEIENIKKRLDQKLLHGAHAHPVSSKINELSSTPQPVSRFSSQDSAIRTSSFDARDHSSVKDSDTSVLSDSRRRHHNHVVKKEKKACPRCGRWCKYACRGATSSLDMVCVNCGKRFQPLKKELDKSRF